MKCCWKLTRSIVQLHSCVHTVPTGSFTHSVLENVVWVAEHSHSTCPVFLALALVTTLQCFSFQADVGALACEGTKRLP